MREDRLREIREARQLSQRDLSARCGIGEKQIWRYENGESVPSTGHLTKIAQELSVSTDYLLGLTDDPGELSPEMELTPLEHKLIMEIRKPGIIPIFQAMEMLIEIAKERPSFRYIIPNEAARPILVDLEDQSEFTIVRMTPYENIIPSTSRSRRKFSIREFIHLPTVFELIVSDAISTEEEDEQSKD